MVFAHPNNPFKILYGSAFRVATADEQEFTNDNEFSVRGTLLDPEVVQTTNLIWQSHFSRVKTELGYFESHFHDTITQILDANGTTRTYINQDQPNIKGIEFESSINLSQHLDLTVTASHLIGFDTEIFLEPESTASATLSIIYQPITVSLSYAYQGERKGLGAPGEEALINYDDFWTSRAKLQYQFNDRWRWYVYLNNLSGEQHAYPVNSPRMGQSIESRGFSFSAGVSTDF